MNPFNPEAGETPAPTDPAELALARAASAVVWRAFPYFAWRYGARGQRFGLSDTGWLITLARLPAAAQVTQVDWLAGLLAPRGMPSWLIEVQVEITARIGARGGWSGARALDELSAALAARRQEVLPQLRFEEAGNRFAAAAGTPSRQARGTGQLLAAARIDVARGVCPSTAPLLGWLSALTVFGPAWESAVTLTDQWVAQAIAGAA